MNRKATILRVCLDARLIPGTIGGVEQAITGLASGLSKLEDGDEEYLFLVHGDHVEWIQSYMQGPCRLLHGPPSSRLSRLKRVLGDAVPAARSAWHRLSVVTGQRAIRVPVSEGTIEASGVEVMHFTKQDGFLTAVPSIYQPHDLQHLHLPEFFSLRHRLAREVLYRRFCEQAEIVSVMTTWGKRDVVEQYGLPEEKVAVVPWAPVLDAYPVPSENDLTTARSKFSLPEAFVFYPAHTWEHKNHIGLLEALAILRDRYGLTVPLVCSGGLTEAFARIQRKTRQLRLTDQVKFLGFVSPLELQSLYRLSRCMVFPSKFEGWGLPVTEAFLAGVPVACSNVTSLPDLAGDAALVFDPYQPGEIADAVRRLWTDEALRDTLVERGKNNVARFTWDRTARTFRAHYRRIANRPLTEEDRSLLASPPLL